MLRKTKKEDDFKIGWRNINNQFCADDTTLIDETANGLQALVMKINKQSANMGL